MEEGILNDKAYGTPDILEELKAGMYIVHRHNSQVVAADHGTTEAKQYWLEHCKEMLFPIPVHLFFSTLSWLLIIAIDDDDSEYGFSLRPARSRRTDSLKLAEVEFADDVTLSLIADTIEEAKLLLDKHKEWG